MKDATSGIGTDATNRWLQEPLRAFTSYEAWVATTLDDGE